MEENRNEITEVMNEKKKIDIVRILKDVGLVAVGSVLTIAAAAIFGDKIVKGDGNGTDGSIQDQNG